MTWSDEPIRKRGLADLERWAREHDAILIAESQRVKRENEAREKARTELRAGTGVSDPELEVLEALHFTPDTVSLLPLVPVIRVAWADGEVTDAERTALLDLARTRGIEDGSAADAKLKEWLAHRPEEAIFASAGRLISVMLSGPNAINLSADDLVKYCEIIASASGGILGIHRISSEERALLTSIASELKA